jgi:hypothetical protein
MIIGYYRVTLKSPIQSRRVCEPISNAYNYRITTDSTVASVSTYSDNECTTQVDGTVTYSEGVCTQAGAGYCEVIFSDAFHMLPSILLVIASAAVALRL